jgi:C-terminal processing protease CtpA/Prc
MSFRTQFHQILRKRTLLVLLSLSLGAPSLGLVHGAEGTDSLPQLPEIIEVIREHLPQITQEDLDRAALQGILTEFQSQLEIVANQTDVPTEAEESPSALTHFYESSVGYLAAPMIDPTAFDSIQQGFTQLDSKNILQGFILDLRHVSGSHYKALTQIAGLFTSKSIPLLDWGEGIQLASPQSTIVTTPLVALIDETTQGAGEALAAIIRTAKLGILVGQKTSGEIHSYENVPLKSGQTLKLATGQIRLANGEKLGTNGIEPDIFVSADDTRPLTAPETDSQADSEADDSESPPSSLAIPEDDAILTRAFELLKGINIVEGRNRSK